MVNHNDPEPENPLADTIYAKIGFFYDRMRVNSEVFQKLLWAANGVNVQQIGVNVQQIGGREPAQVVQMPVRAPPTTKVSADDQLTELQMQAFLARTVPTVEQFVAFKTKTDERYRSFAERFPEVRNMGPVTDVGEHGRRGAYCEVHVPVPGQRPLLRHAPAGELRRNRVCWSPRPLRQVWDSIENVVKMSRRSAATRRCTSCGRRRQHKDRTLEGTREESLLVKLLRWTCTTCSTSS